jgi:class 3 adenylate cyclase
MRRIYEITGKFVPYEFIGSLGHKVITDIKLGDQVEKIVTVLFSDIRNYTTLSEKMTPEENFSFVCSFNERMGPIIRKHNGFINQYLGDAIMAYISRRSFGRTFSRS